MHILVQQIFTCFCNQTHVATLTLTNKIFLFTGLPMEFTNIIAFAKDSPEIFGHDKSNKTVLWDGSNLLQITKDKLDHLLQITSISTVEHCTRQQICNENIAAGNNIGE